MNKSLPQFLTSLFHSTKDVLKHCLLAASTLAYPPLCLHCQVRLEEPAPIFCKDCVSLLELINPMERCPFCFSPDFYLEKRFCPACKKMPPLLHRIASAFDYVGPAATVVKKMKYANQPYLAEGCAAFMAAQFSHLDWPMPDLIVPVPIPLLRSLSRGYNQSFMLAQELSKLIDRPVCRALKRRSGDYSQAALSHEQRMELSSSSFYLARNVDIYDRSILLVDDVLTTGMTLKRCAESLLEQCPGKIYGLTVCRAIK